ncbi:Fic family protein [Bifidobacterium tissieri]|uniref:Fic family protein n=1 Tax=Bifidobacterium tissieri TaxID=1630162 RepID=A0A5M9ZX59_9BIFI|nr:Fic family protein [Bifidobacterium tissieri]KAA8832172.1 Fic family protein [Bifidobacterium tissieri]KAA8832214.1 Fic family protein [Bifidobacterium tissieri]
MPEPVRLVTWLQREREQRADGGLYATTQILFSYNSNHMEGSTLSLEQTAQLFDTGALLPSNANNEIKADDVIETTNHFRVFDWMLDHVDEPVNRDMICTMHAMLKRGTRQELDPVRNVGGYKVLPNVISQLVGIHTALPKDVPAAMEHVFHLYASLTDDPYAIARAHWMFESTHPFSDGNGRIGRLVMFKELLRLDTIPALILDQHHNLYTRALTNFPDEPGYLVDLLLSERDHYQRLVRQLAPERISYTYNDQWDRSSVTASVRNPYVKDRWDEEELRRGTRS